MRMDIKVKAGKNENKVIKRDFCNYEVWVKSPPTKGLANKELIKVLANYFNIKPHNLRLVKGLTSPQKIVELIR